MNPRVPKFSAAEVLLPRGRGGTQRVSLAEQELSVCVPTCPGPGLGTHHSAGPGAGRPTTERREKGKEGPGGDWKGGEAILPRPAPFFQAGSRYETPRSTERPHCSQRSALAEAAPPSARRTAAPGESNPPPPLLAGV